MFWFSIVQAAIENIEFTENSRKLVEKYSADKMHMKIYEDTSRKASDIIAQQKIAEGIRDNGFGDTGGMIMGVNMANVFGTNAEKKANTGSFDQQVENLKKLKELLDAGILTEDEFIVKRKKSWDYDT